MTLTREPSSFGQCMMWIVEQQLAGPGAMTVPLALRMRGPLDEDALGAALGRLVERHETLRSTLAWTDGSRALPDALEQRVHAAAAAPPTSLRAHDVRATTADPWARVEQLVLARLREPLDVVAGPPLSLDLYRVAPEDHLLLARVHHLVTDAWSNVVLWRDLAALYSGHALAPVTTSFRDHVTQHNDRVLGEAGEAHAAFWRERLASLEYAEIRPPVERGAGEHRVCHHEWFELDRETTRRLQQAAAARGVELPTLMLAAFFAVLHQLGGQRDLAIGTVVANREDPALHDTVGYLSNIATLDVQLPETPSFADVLAATRHAQAAIAPHQHFPFLSLLVDPAVPQTARRAADVVFQMPLLPPAVAPPDGIRFAGLDVEWAPVPDGTAGRCDLELLVTPRDGILEGDLRHAPDRYERALAQDVVVRYERVLRDVAAT